MAIGADHLTSGEFVLEAGEADPVSGQPADVLRLSIDVVELQRSEVVGLAVAAASGLEQVSYEVHVAPLALGQVLPVEDRGVGSPRSGSLCSPRFVAVGAYDLAPRDLLLESGRGVPCPGQFTDVRRLATHVVELEDLGVTLPAV
jgi:hypothetical protein